MRIVGVRIVDDNGSSFLGLASVDDGISPGRHLVAFEIFKTERADEE